MDPRLCPLRLVLATALSLGGTLAGSLSGSLASAQPAPITNEFRVNSYTSNNQTSPAAAGLPGGGFVVMWESNLQDAALQEIYAQRYAADGDPVGGEFRVNAVLAGNQDEPSVAGRPDSGFVAVWASSPGLGQDADVYARWYDADGDPAGDEVRVNTATANDQSAAAVASLPGGGFVVVWESEGQDGSGYGVYAQRYAASGAPAGGEFRVNTVTADDQTQPVVAGLGGGGFVVVWASDDGSSLRDILAQRYDAGGTPVGGPFVVNTYTENDQYQPAVAALSDGGYAVAWASLLQDGGSWGVYAQRYDADGVPVGGERHANAGYTLNLQDFPAVAGLAGGGFVVAWESNLQDGSELGVYARRFDGTGGDEPAFLVNVTTENIQAEPTVAALTNGGFAVAWEDEILDGSLYGVYARVYGSMPVANEPGPSGGELRAEVAPNPARLGAARLTLDLARPARVSLEVYDALGRLLVRRPAVAFAAGSGHALPLPTLPPGVYLYRLGASADGAPPTAGRVTTGTFTVVH